MLARKSEPHRQHRQRPNQCGIGTLRCPLAVIGRFGPPREQDVGTPLGGEMAQRPCRRRAVPSRWIWRARTHRRDFASALLLLLLLLLVAGGRRRSSEAGLPSSGSHDSDDMEASALQAAAGSALRKVMLQERVATKNDLEKLRAELERHDKQFERLQMRTNALEKREAWTAGPGALRDPRHGAGAQAQAVLRRAARGSPPEVAGRDHSILEYYRPTCLVRAACKCHQVLPLKFAGAHAAPHATMGVGLPQGGPRPWTWLGICSGHCHGQTHRGSHAYW